MTLEDQLLVTIGVVPPERQREVLDFAEFSTRKHIPPLQAVLDQIRDKARDVDEAELQTLIDEARQDYSHVTSR